MIRRTEVPVLDNQRENLTPQVRDEVLEAAPEESEVVFN